MKANELRIGNWVCRTESLRNDVIGCVRFDEYDWYAIGECRDDLESYEPIPITEEWLLRFGFKDILLDNNYMCNGYVVIHKVYGFMLSPFDNFAPFEYVHQLQNLYFALTGEELEIKKG